MYKEFIDKLKKEQIDVVNCADKPTFIFVGGQVGAGKTALTNTILSQDTSREFVVIDVDLYRKIFYDVYQKKISPNSLVKETSEFANVVEAELMDYAISEGKNIISCSSMRATSLIENIILHSLKPNGYIVESSLIVTPFIECLISSYERYENEIEKKDFGIPRSVDINFMKIVQNAYPETVQMLYDKEYATTIELYRRGMTARDKCILEKRIKCGSGPINFKELILKVESLQNRNLHNTIFCRINELVDRLNKRTASKGEYQTLYDIYEFAKKDHLTKTDKRCFDFNIEK